MKATLLLFDTGKGLGHVLCLYRIASENCEGGSIVAISHDRLAITVIGTRAQNGFSVLHYHQHSMDSCQTDSVIASS